MKFSKSAAYAVTVAAISGGAVFAPAAQAAVGTTATVTAVGSSGQGDLYPGCGDCHPDVI
ncbi:hypothetical protein ACIP5Y_12345 [Nocardia sp. NPDC088792]|uniref:hypothetical protein n=1 Tax=Nocardia sp. NPDC088792 TaxID=3364332 RepID=UPI00382883BB